MPFPTIKAILYDMDGLLLDTEPFYTQATQAIVAPYGKTFDWTVKGKMIGKKALDAARILVADLELPITAEEYLEKRVSMLDALFPTAEPLPGAVALTKHLKSKGIPQAVATSSRRDAFLLKTSRHQEWFGVFDQVVTSSDPEVKEGKPAPDIFLAAARRLGVAPADCLVFEDAPSGMEAALAAGMSVVVVPDPNMDRAEYARATQILDSLLQFVPQDWGLPALP